MAKLVALYKKPANVAAFDNYYYKTHLPIAKKVPGLRGYEVSTGVVGTPQGEDGSADLQHVLEVAAIIGRHMRREMVVVTKSTVPVGSSAKIEKAVATEAKFPFHVCSNPEFLKEGAAVDAVGHRGLA